MKLRWKPAEWDALSLNEKALMIAFINQRLEDEKKEQQKLQQKSKKSRGGRRRR